MMIRNILLSLVVLVIIGGCSAAPATRMYKLESAFNNEKDILPRKLSKKNSEKTRGEFQNVGFDKESGLYTGHKGASVYVLDPGGKPLSAGYHRIYRQEGMLIGERGSLKFVLDSHDYHPVSKGFQSIYRGEFGQLIGSMGSAEYIIDSNGRVIGDYQEFRRSIVEVCTPRSAIPTQSGNINPREAIDRRSEIPAWMKPFAEVDVFGNPTIFSKDHGRRK